MPCLRLLRLEAALPASVAGPPMPVRSVFKSRFARSGFLGRGARGCLVFGGAVLVDGGAEASGVPEADVSETGVSDDCASADSETASGVPGASDDASMGWSVVGSA